jgi:hypothetical protein
VLPHITRPNWQNPGAKRSIETLKITISHTKHVIDARRTRERPSDRVASKPRFIAEPLLAALLAGSILIGCGKPPERKPMPEIDRAAIADARVLPPLHPLQPAPSLAKHIDAAIPAKESDTAPQNREASECVDSLCALHKKGYRKIAEMIMSRVKQQRKKMKLTIDEGEKAAGYINDNLLIGRQPAMPQAKSLINHMPKTTIELLRSVHERGVPKEDGEMMAKYLLRFLVSMRIRNYGKFDECISHVIGREWHQIDYSGEGMTWQSQKKLYASEGVSDLKTARHLHGYLKIEKSLRYFNKLFRPSGRLPAFGEDFNPLQPNMGHGL